MKLKIKHLGKVIQEIQLEEGQEYFGGRQKDCELLLEDETLSRKHIKIYQSPESGNWVIESISEKKGLYFENENIDLLELENSMTVSLNNYTFEFSVEEPSENKQESENLSTSEEFESKNENNTFSKSTKILAPSSLVHSLHISIEGESSDHMPLNEGESWVLGRSENCDIYIDYNVLSREHIRFLKSGNTFTVTDLNSSNGSLLNNEDMEPNKPYILNAEDRVTIGELNITFEIRNKNFENMMNNLPAVVSEKKDSPTTMAFPKIVLEEISPEEEQPKNAKFFNKKRIAIFSGGGLLLLGLLFFTSKKDGKEQAQKNKAEIEKANSIKESYSLAVQFLEQKKFQFCIDEIHKLHRLTEMYLDSKQILTQCQNSSENQKKYDEYLANEKKKKETEEKVKKMTEECQKKSSTFQTVDDLYVCAKEILELDPSNAIINSIKLEIEEKETTAKMAEEKNQQYREMIQSKRYLYNKAKKINKKDTPLKAVAAYKVFLNSSKGISGLSSLRKKAKKEMNKIQTNYNTTLKKLYSHCEKFIEEGKMKKAYYECKAILKFKKEDAKAQKHMELAKSTIRKNLKDIYAKSVFEESLANIEEAKKLWQKILKEDIEGGHYHKKATILSNKYK